MPRSWSLTLNGLMSPRTWSTTYLGTIISATTGDSESRSIYPPLNGLLVYFWSHFFFKKIEDINSKFKLYTIWKILFMLLLILENKKTVNIYNTQ